MVRVRKIDKFYRFVYAKKKVQIFDLYTLDWTSKQLSTMDGSHHLLIDNCQVIQTEKCRVFLIGGHLSLGVYSTKVSEYLPSENRLVERTQFNIARTSFSLCSLMGYVIYMVGGQIYEDDKYRMCNQTEKYYIEDNEWDILPPVLNQPKCGVALCKF